MGEKRLEIRGERETEKDSEVEREIEIRGEV